MKMKMNVVLAAALSVLAVGGAQAGVDAVGASSLGNSSVLFVAHDATDQITLVVDLGLTMSQLLPGAALTSSSIEWNFSNNTATDSSITGNSWSGAYGLFKGTQSGGDFTWGVIAADSVGSGAAPVSVTNAIAGRGWLATGNPTTTQMLGLGQANPVTNALGDAGNFWAAATNSPTGNMSTANNGAATATAGTVFGAMRGNFNDRSPWSYLVGNGIVSNFQYVQLTSANPSVFQIGTPTSGSDLLNQAPLTFRFDVATDTLVMAPVPEPSTYALMLAGLAGVVLLARRRRA